MKKCILFVFLTLILSQVFGQGITKNEEMFCLSFGIGHGGGSIIGADLEIMPIKRLGIQAGIGYSFFGEGATMRVKSAITLFSYGPGMSFGGALNFHLKPQIKSNFISLLYWQRFGEMNTNYPGENFFLQSIMGSTFVWRSSKWFTAQLGLGTPLSWVGSSEPRILLLFSMGAYLPF